MNFENILVDIANGLAKITINRPKKLNALNSATIAELSSAFKTLEDDKNVKVIIITGSGEKAFVAGADISEFANFSIEEGGRLARLGQESLFDLVAKDCGLVNHVVSLDELMPLSEKLASKIMRNSSVAISAAIRAVNDNFKDGINGYETEIAEFGDCFGTEDFKEGTTAFLEKRKPEFPGK